MWFDFGIVGRYVYERRFHRFLQFFFPSFRCNLSRQIHRIKTKRPDVHCTSTHPDTDRVHLGQCDEPNILVQRLFFFRAENMRLISFGIRRVLSPRRRCHPHIASSGISPPTDGRDRQLQESLSKHVVSNMHVLIYLLLQAAAPDGSPADERIWYPVAQGPRSYGAGTGSFRDCGVLPVSALLSLVPCMVLAFEKKGGGGTAGEADWREFTGSWKLAPVLHSCLFSLCY
jgi:hypothetical protein